MDKNKGSPFRINRLAADLIFHLSDKSVACTKAEYIIVENEMHLLVTDKGSMHPVLLVIACNFTCFRFESNEIMQNKY